MALERHSLPSETVQLKLDKKTLRHAEKLAAARRLTLAELLQEVIAGLDKPADPLCGLFRDEPEIMDQVVNDAMTTLETHPLRLPRE
jgi:hypothetical protein